MYSMYSPYALIGYRLHGSPDSSLLHVRPYTLLHLFKRGLLCSDKTRARTAMAKLSNLFDSPMESAPSSPTVKMLLSQLETDLSRQGTKDELVKYQI
jgi:hypothetical protein